MKIPHLAIVCLVAILAVYCGVTLFSSVHTAVNVEKSVLWSPALLSKNSASRPGLIPLGDPVLDPRPH